MPGRKVPGSRSHAKGASKGQRWARGHSCVSNPKTTKFRDQASSGFLHPVSDNPLFTVKNVAAVQNRDEGKDLSMEEDLTSEVDSLSISDVSCGTGLSSISTLKSLSSAWSKCSTNAFDRFLKKFRANSLVHKEMLSILAASSEVINGHGGKLNETEFFATFLSLLDSCQPDQYQPVMSLVCIITPRVSPSVLKLRFTDIYPKIATILTHASENNNDLLLRTSIEAFLKLIRVQDRLPLEEDKPLQSVLYLILKCTLHERPRVRKKARFAIKRFVTAPGSATPLTKLTLGWILDQLSMFPTCDAKQCADVLSLLLNIWPLISSITKPGAKKLFEAVLRVMSSGDSNIMKIGLSFFIECFTNFTTIAKCDPDDELFSKLIVCVWELQPDTRNTSCFILWLRCILAGIVRLRQGPAAYDMNYLSRSLEASSSLWITSHAPDICQLFKEYLPHLITSALKPEILIKLFRVLSKNLLTVPPNLIALQLLEGLLDCLTPAQYSDAAQDVFLQLIPLRHAQGVIPAMGRFIRAFGVDPLWTTVDPATRWLVILPLIQENLHNSEILFWKKEILPGLGTKAKVDVGWASLTGFCRNPKDPENFPAELLGKVIVERPEVRLQALAALRQFVEWPQCQEVCKKYGKNYLPILFNLYIKTKPDSQNLPGHCDAVGATIQKYLEHCDPQFISELTNRALTKLTTEVDTAANPVFDLVAFLATHETDKELQDKILEGTVKKWVKTQDSKRAYRIMTSLSKNKELNKDILLKLLDTLKQTKAETKSNAAALRLECIGVVTILNPEWLKDFLPEVVINLLSVNAKAKKLAGQSVQRFSEYLKESQHGDVSSVMEILRVGMGSPIPLMVCCTLKFACLLYRELVPEEPNKELLDASIAHLQNHPDPQVWKHCLQWLCLNLQLYKGQLGVVAGPLGQIVSDQTKYPKKDSTRLLARMVKVFGSVGVRAIVVNAEDPKMRNRIKNICKKLRERSKKKDSGGKEDDDDEEAGHESEEEDEGIDFDGRIGSKSKLVMKEGVVDFLSPSDVAQSFINERPAKKAEAFKMTKDGKLIIDVEDPKKGRKRKAAGESSDEEEDDDDENEGDNEDDMSVDSDGDDDKLVKSLQKKTGGKSNMSAKSIRSSGSKFSMRSWKSAKSNGSMRSKRSSGGRSQQGGSGGAGIPKGKSKGIRRELPDKTNKNKRFKGTSSASSVKSGKSRKSSAASTFRLKF